MFDKSPQSPESARPATDPTGRRSIDPQAVRWPTLVPDEPIQGGALAVYPLLNPDAPPAEPGYLLLEPALKSGLVQITEVHEGGNVPTLALRNHAALPVLALQGQELVGAKQNRTLNVTILAPSGRTEIPVTCVERGRWAYRSRRFGAGGFEHFGLRHKKAAMVADAAKRHHDKTHRYRVDQMAVWDEVDHESARHQVRSATSALNDVYAAPQVAADLGAFDELDTLPEGTVGVVVAMGGGLVAAEFLETPPAFAEVWPNLKRGYALSALGRKEKAAPSRTEAEAFVAWPSAGKVETGEAVGLGVDVRSEGKAFMAAALAYEGRLLHGTLFARDGQKA